MKNLWFPVDFPLSQSVDTTLSFDTHRAMLGILFVAVYLVEMKGQDIGQWERC